MDELKSFKKITGGDSLFTEFKGQQPFEFVFNGLLWFCMNKLPKFSGDMGQWVYDRIMVVNCPNVIPVEQQDKQLLDKMYAEKEGIVPKCVIYDILSNIYYFYILASNNANSLTTEVVCKMAGSYYEKEKSYSQSNNISISTSYREKQVLRPEDLNQQGEDAVLLISNHGYVRTRKEGSAYYKTEPFKSQHERIVAINQNVMEGA